MNQMFGPLNSNQACFRAVQHSRYHIWDDIPIGYVPQNASVYARRSRDVFHDANPQLLPSPRT